jgi:hypothetical protein
MKVKKIKAVLLVHVHPMVSICQPVIGLGFRHVYRALLMHTVR